MKTTDFAAHLTSFLGDYLPVQRRVSPNTVKAYRDTFKLLLQYCRDEKRIPPDKLQMKDFDAKMVTGFLDHIENERHCSARTCNQRLAAIHAFIRFVMMEEPHMLLQCQRIIAIPFQKHQYPEVNYLSGREIEVILSQTNLTTIHGRRDTTLLCLMYDTGARVQEMIDLSVHDIRLDTPAQVRLTGKGHKSRSVPLTTHTASMLSAYMEENGLTHKDYAPVFTNRQGKRFTRAGVTYILKKNVEKARETLTYLSHDITPHTFRHTKAMHLLQAGNPIAVIQKILGHSDVKTTEIYARADIEMKLKAMEKAALATPSLLPPSWQSDKNLLQWLKEL